MRASMIIAPTAVLALGLAGCASDSTSGDSNSGNGDLAVATTTIWGSVTEQIAACVDGGAIETLIPVGADPHDYAASSSDVATMVGADLVVANGLGLEEGLAAALESAEADGANVFSVAPLLDPVPLADDGHADGEDHEGEEGDDHKGEEADDHEGEEGEDHGHEGDDPHVWLDMGRVARAAELIGEELASTTGQDAYRACGTEVAADISATEAEVVEILAAVPDDRRILITDHDALGYFADAYGFTIAGVVIPGGSTLAEASSARLAELAATIEDSGISAIFSNTSSPTTVIDALAAEVGEVQVVPLFVGSVGEPGTEAGTYQGMMLANASAIAGALS